jgi:hypothetical protein
VVVFKCARGGQTWKVDDRPGRGTIAVGASLT